MIRISQKVFKSSGKILESDTLSQGSIVSSIAIIYKQLMYFASAFVSTSKHDKSSSNSTISGIVVVSGVFHKCFSLKSFSSEDDEFADT